MSTERHQKGYPDEGPARAAVADALAWVRAHVPAAGAPRVEDVQQFVMVAPGPAADEPHAPREWSVLRNVCACVLTDGVCVVQRRTIRIRRRRRSARCCRSRTRSTSRRLRRRVSCRRADAVHMRRGLLLSSDSVCGRMHGARRVLQTQILQMTRSGEDGSTTCTHTVTGGSERTSACNHVHTGRVSVSKCDRIVKKDRVEEQTIAIGPYVQL